MSKKQSSSNRIPYYEKTFERHKKDLTAVESGLRDDIRFNKKLGVAYVKIIEQLKHFEGELAGQRIQLEDWQRRSIAICFGWQKKRLDRYGDPILKNGRVQWIRRFNYAFWFIPRKNGKSILASGVGIAESILTLEKGNQIVSYATKKEQAKIIWNGCKKMVESNIELNKNSTIAYSTININPTSTTIRPLGRDSKTEDGLNIGMGIGDETHAHPNRDMREVIESSQGSRVQPMMFDITTAGFDTASSGAIEYEYAKKVMDGIIEDDNYFAFICELDKGDDPFDESVWYKANPNLGISKSWDYMRKQAKQAKERSETRNNFFVKDLNKWVNAAEHFINFDDWEACKADEVDLSEAIAVLLGVDLSRTDDFTAKAKTYLFPNNRFHTTQHYYIPADTVKERESELRAPLTKWILEGYITATPGNTIDYDYIQKDILKDIEDGVDEICYDPYRAATLISNIERESEFEGCVQIRQGYMTISEPTFNFKDSIKKKTLTHDGNPVTKWMVSNMSVLSDAAGNIKPDKSKPNRKIDGCAAIINTLARAISYEPKEKSVYEERGIRTI
ncbi:terminase TerL endonuclease subunit [Sulfurimonas sp. HSL-1716]|uniref:terminase large subunit n=1 Tax=Hydrocurvibacter sulfurireducens TaxID=3131937 RepID=UPI0031F80B90